MEYFYKVFIEQQYLEFLSQIQNRGKIPTTCAILVLQNDIKCKYIIKSFSMKISRTRVT